VQLTARIWPDDRGFIAECVELNVVSEGDSEKAALSNLREAVEGFLECADPSEVRERMHAAARFSRSMSRSEMGRLHQDQRRVAEDRLG
jgi:predicted RNase H-like HicB family nuclease